MHESLVHHEQNSGGREGEAMAASARRVLAADWTGEEEGGVQAEQGFRKGEGHRTRG